MVWFHVGFEIELPLEDTQLIISWMTSHRLQSYTMYMTIYQPPSLHTLLSITYAITVVEWTVKNWEVPWMILCSMFVRGAQMCLKSR